jgi:hypothetical protein
MRWLVPAAIAVVLPAGCVGSAPTGRSPEPSPSLWGPAISAREALAQVPLDGTKEIPIHWELPETDDADESAAILTARRFRAVDFFRQSRRDWNAHAYLYQWLTIGDARDSIIRRFSTGSAEHGQRAGPVWIWVLDAERRTATEIHVHMCSDTRWVDFVERPVGDLPHGSKGRWQTYTVKLVATRDGARWLVDFVDDSRITDRGDRYDRCDAWAGHDRGEGR